MILHNFEFFLVHYRAQQHIKFSCPSANSLRLYLYWLPCFKVALSQVLFCQKLHPSYPICREIWVRYLISQFSMTCILKLQKTHSKLYFSTHKNSLQQFEISLLNDQKRNNCRRTARWCKIWNLRKRHFAVISIFLVTPSKLANNPSVLFRLSETKVVNVSVVNAETNLWRD